MALDLYAGERREQIGPQDEYLLQRAATESTLYPQLSALWSDFYSDPRISPRQAADLVHELLMLLTSTEVERKPNLVRRGLQLATFFNVASREGEEVRAKSD